MGSLCQVQFHQSLLTSKRVELMMGYHLLVLMVAGLASSHEYFPEKCPEFQPMQGFDWDQFSNGVWYVTQKFATRSTCLTYEFTTDYSSYALICTCQEIDLFITTGHRRSCSILQRAVEEDEAITDKLIELLDSQVPDSSHDFDPIKQEGCEHGREKAWTIDPEKVIGGGVGSSVREAVDQIANEFEFKTAEQVKEEAEAALI